MFVFRPWRAEDDLLRTMFNWPASRFALPTWRGDHALSFGTVPQFDFVDHGDAASLVIDAPGADADDVNLTFENGMLTANITRRRGDRTFEITRSVALGNIYDPDTIEAKLDKGILEIRVAKKAEAMPKQIPVGSAAPKQLQEKTQGGSDG